MVVNRTLTSLFQDTDGNKITGLTPTVQIFDVTGGMRIVVGTFPMTELTTGLYVYTYTTFDTRKEYILFFDGGSSLDESIRYKTAGTNGEENIENPLEEIKNHITDIANAENIITIPS